MWKYGAIKFSSFVQCLIGFGFFLGVTLPGNLPAIVYRSIYSMQIFFFSSSRIQQILTNYKNKSTGALSPITMFLGWAGNLARLFTLIVDIGFGDLQIILSYFVFFALNFTPFMQYCFYMNNQVEEKPEKKKGTSEEKTEKEKIVTVKKSKRKEEEPKKEQVVVRRKKAKKRED
jgi:mannose-P-dolichol utilization defect protein 1